MKRIVVKIGSSIIAPRGKLDVNLVRAIVKDILAVEAKGAQVVVVSSGAIACGLDKLGYRRRPPDIHSLMAISSVGQIILMDVFGAKFKKYQRTCAQVLLTDEDFDVRQRFMNIRKTIDRLLAMKIIPIINENDVISYDEIRVGDNDRISARVADLIGAQLLVMLSDVKGLLKQDTVVKVVPRIDESIKALVRKEAKTHTAGGMETKLIAADIATSSGIKTAIVYGREKSVLARLVDQEHVGTIFLPAEKLLNARKRWIAFSKKVKGKIFIDAGAKEAILNRGKSLLGVGIIASEGLFKKGDAVHVVDQAGKLLGCGLANYDGESLKSAREKRLAKEVIHRDDFVKAP